MPSEIQIRQALPADVSAVHSILTEACAWLEQSGFPLWRNGELAPARIASDIGAGLFFLAELDGQPVATLIFQLEDPVFWPDFVLNEAAYIHRLAVRRSHAGTGLSAALIHWAAARAHTLGRRYLRLDFESSRTRLRALYERLGFYAIDDRQVGPYHVSRFQLDVAAPAP